MSWAHVFRQQVWLSLSYGIRTYAFAHFVYANVYEFKATHGESMLPTLNTQNDFVHTLKSYKYGRGVEMGDVIVMLKPTEPHSRVCKRISGMPGDIIIIDPSNHSLEEDADLEKCQDSFDKYIRVPEGHVWVTGDNLSLSLDSRTYSVIPMGLIRGKIVAAQDFNDTISTFWGFRKIKSIFQEVKVEDVK